LIFLITNREASENEIKDMFKRITYKRKDILKDSLMESQRMGNFERIFPAKGTDKYFKYFHSQNNTNKILYDFLYIQEKEDEKEIQEPIETTLNNFFEPTSESSGFFNTNKHFLDLEAKLRPLKQRPDSAANPMRYKGLSTNDSNMSTRSTNKPNESISNTKVSIKKKRNTEDILIDYFQGILDNIKNQYVFYSDKNAPVVNFEQLEEMRPNNKPIAPIFVPKSCKLL